MSEENKEHIKLLFKKQDGKCAKCGAQLTTFNAPLNDQLFCGECWIEPIDHTRANIQEKFSKEKPSIKP